MKRSPVIGVAIVAALAASLFSCSRNTASNGKAPTGYITGTVQSEKGPEDGVWVIAQTDQLPTGFIKTRRLKFERSGSPRQNRIRGLVCYACARIRRAIDQIAG